MSEKTPDFTPAPGILPEGMYGPDNFSVMNSVTRTHEAADARGFRMVERSAIPSDVQDEFSKYPDDAILLESDRGYGPTERGYKAYTRETFNKIQEKAAQERQAERAPLYAEAQAQVDQLVDQHGTPEQALTEAQAVFNERLEQEVRSYREILQTGKAALGRSVEELTAAQRKVEWVIQEGLDTLKIGINHPESVWRAINDTIEALGRTNQLLGLNAESANDARHINQSLRNNAEGHKDGVKKFHGEFSAAITHVGRSNDIDMSSVARIDGAAAEKTARETVAVDNLDDALGAINKLIMRSEVAGEETGSYTRRLLGQLEDMRARAASGRLDMDEYHAVVRSMNSLLSDYQGGSQARQLTQAVGEL